MPSSERYAIHVRSVFCFLFFLSKNKNNTIQLEGYILKVQEYGGTVARYSWISYTLADLFRTMGLVTKVLTWLDPFKSFIEHLLFNGISLNGIERCYEISPSIQNHLSNIFYC